MGHEVATSGLSRATAPTGGMWSGAVTKVTASTGDGLEVRVVGVADLAVHLEALSLAAGALTIESFGYGASRPEDRAEDYLTPPCTPVSTSPPTRWRPEPLPDRPGSGEVRLIQSAA